MAASSGAPRREDEPVGLVLSRMRRAKRLTGARLAAMVGMSQPKISRIERGKGLADPEDVGAIARALGADDSLARDLMDRAERSHDRMTDWRPASIGLAALQKTLHDWESSATSIRAFEPALIPGPLQTSGYAKLVLQTMRRIAPMMASDLTESGLLAAVSARVTRQEVLGDSSKTFQFVLGEATLKHRLFPPVEMLAQIAHLRAVITQTENLRVTVIPDDALIEVPLLHGFFLYDDDLVIVDLYNTGLLSRSHKDVESYRRIFDALEKQSTDVVPLLDEYEANYIRLLRDPQRPPR
ncbi:helix-turn-helix domain-containing protein [Paractinoplanes hotanensis]|uniref:Helix-turn-helix domain-containing protein n=1 Tax=Paractinoplanes hotanensis TaxID=2906497 RepID=A0ABT0YB20_9ACTN|nr:helix-turn-helix transcriptional regulator [Actinoplanes hotanensis]MCM4083231.1 helix-turn-helix domain-containing protein [Actinoplanes hotanensis]